MTRAVRKVQPNASLSEVAHIMRGDAISCLVVCEEDRPVGVISERDIVRLLEDVLNNNAPGSAGKMMSSPVITIMPTATVSNATRTLLSRRIRRLVVVDEDDAVLGVVTQTDLTRGQVAELEDHRELLEAEVADRTKELVDASKELESTNEARAEFLATMSHEIRTPLNGILGTVALLLDMELEEEHHDYLATIDRAGRTLLTILNDVLDLSKIDAGELSIDEEVFDVRDVANDVAILLAARAQERGDEIVVRTSDDFPKAVIGDPVRLQQILQNLVSNAIKFTEHGWIDVCLSSTMRSDGRANIRVEVRDTGLGMVTVDVNRIFQPYQQAHGDARVRAKGTGLGLTICKRLVELMGGRIGVTSKRGAGSMFYVDVPVGVASGVVAQKIDVSAPSFDGLRILVVEDDPVNRRIAQKTLESMGCEVTVAMDGLAAVQHTAQRGPFDLVFMDCEMPLLDGFGATAEIRRLEGEGALARQPIIAMTAHTQHAIKTRCLEAGMDDFVTKPTTKAILAGHLARVAAPLLDVGT